MSKKKKSFLAGAAVLGVAGLLCKIIGALYRVPLVYLIEEMGMAYYQAAYPVYNFLLVLASGGLPVAISKLVSEQVTNGNFTMGKRIFRVAFGLLVILGLFGSLMMLALSNVIAEISIHSSQGRFALMAIAPSIVVVTTISAFRGYFQGHQNMYPTAFSQVIEQVFKLLFGYGLASYMVQFGPEYGAAGALLGVTISECIALLFLVVYYRLKRRTLEPVKIPPIREDFKSVRHIGGMIMKIALPVTIGASIMPLVNMVDSLMIVRRLVSAGIDQLVATEYFGLLAGSIMSIINMPSVLTVALAMALVPAISSALTRRDTAAVQRSTLSGIKLAWVVALPCTIGLWLLAGPILTFLYRGLREDAGKLHLAVQLMSSMSFAVLFLSVLQTTTGILQGIGHPEVPVYSLLIGAAIKAILNYVLVSIPSINIHGAPIASIACYLVAALINLYWVVRYTGVKLKPIQTFVQPAIAGVGMGVAVYYLSKLLILPDDHSRKMTVVIVLLAAVVYAVLLLLTGSIRREDVGSMPFGKKLERVMVKLRIWRA